MSIHDHGLAYAYNYQSVQLSEERATMVRRSLIGLMVVIIVGIAGFALLQSDDDESSRNIEAGELLDSVTFDEAGQWEEGEYVAYRPNTDEVISRTTLTIQNGHYEMTYETADPSFTLGLGGERVKPAANVIIDVNTEQLSGADDNLYGVVCRLTVNEAGRPTGGYAVLISGDGHYGIAQLRSTNLEFILDWHQSDVIKQGQAQNTIRAVCVDDYVGIYVDGQFLGEVNDVSNQSEGQVALIVGTNRDQKTHIAFDDLAVRSASWSTSR